MNSEIDAYQQSIINNIHHVRKRITSACLNYGGDPQSVRLLLATKTITPHAIRMAAQEGETLIGENKVQELVQKADELADLKLEKHFIGHLQKNKIKDVIKHVTCIQTLDNIELLVKLHEKLQHEGKSIDVMVQVNTSFESSKFGLPPEKVSDFLKELKKYDTLKMQGFMTIGLFDTDAEKVRPSYTLLRNIRDNAIESGLIPPHANQLSMGMSGDLEVAIHEGATIVRVGSAILGKRLTKDEQITLGLIQMQITNDINSSQI